MIHCRWPTITSNPIHGGSLWLSLLLVRRRNMGTTEEGDEDRDEEHKMPDRSVEISGGATREESIYMYNRVRVSL